MSFPVVISHEYGQLIGHMHQLPNGSISSLLHWALFYEIITQHGELDFQNIPKEAQTDELFREFKSAFLGPHFDIRTSFYSIQQFIGTEDYSLGPQIAGYPAKQAKCQHSSIWPLVGDYTAKLILFHQRLNRKEGAS